MVVIWEVERPMQWNEIINDEKTLKILVNRDNNNKNTCFINFR